MLKGGEVAESDHAAVVSDVEWKTKRKEKQYNNES